MWMCRRIGLKNDERIGERRPEDFPSYRFAYLCVEFGRARHSVRTADGVVICHHVLARDESRQSHMHRMAATISAIQLTPTGIDSVPTVTWAWLISRRRWPIAKIPKIMLATRRPVLGEFISRLLKSHSDLSAKNRRLYIAVLRNDAACTIMPMIASPTKTRVEPVGGSVTAP